MTGGFFMTIFIAFDQATVITGYSIYKDRELVTYGKFSANGDDFERYLEQKENVINLIQYTVKKFPTAKIKVTFEDIQLQVNTTTFKQLAQLQGVLACAVKESFPDIDINFIYASEWKSFAKVKGRKRNEQKKAAQEKVKELFNVKATQDEADALLIGYFSSHREINFK